MGPVQIAAICMWTLHSGNRTRAGRHQQRVGVGELADEKSIERVVEVHLPESVPGLSFTHVVDGRCPQAPSLPG